MKHKSSYDSINHGFNKLTIDCKDKPFAALLNNQLTGNGIDNYIHNLKPHKGGRNQSNAVKTHCNTVETDRSNSIHDKQQKLLQLNHIEDKISNIKKSLSKSPSPKFNTFMNNNFKSSDNLLTRKHQKSNRKLHEYKSNYITNNKHCPFSLKWFHK